MGFNQGAMMDSPENNDWRWSHDQRRETNDQSDPSEGASFQVGTNNVVLVELEAAAPVDPSEVGGGQFDDIQLEGLLHEHHVVLRHAEAVVVAREQGGAEGDRTHLLDFPQRRLLILVYTVKKSYYLLSNFSRMQESSQLFKYSWLVS